MTKPVWRGRSRRGVTEGPGFTRDTAVETPGTSLERPPWREDDRAATEAALPPLEVTAA